MSNEIPARSPPRYRIFFALLFDTGLRISEAADLKVGDIDRGCGVIHVRHGKGDKERLVKLGVRLYEMLRAHWQAVRMPLARANKRDCLRFLEALLKAKFSTRQAEALQAGWLKGNPAVRERILGDPELFLRSQQAVRSAEDLKGPYSLWLDDLSALAAVARKAGRHLREGAVRGLSEAQGQEADSAVRQARTDCHALFDRSERELTHA